MSCPFSGKKAEDVVAAPAPATEEKKSTGGCPFAAKAAAAKAAAEAEAAAAAAAQAAVEEKPKSSSGGKCPFHNSAAPATSTATIPTGHVDVSSSSSSSSALPTPSHETKTSSELSASELNASSLLAAQGITAESSAAAKQHFLDAYNAVADGVEKVDAATRAAENARVSSILMKHLGYSQQQLDIVGEDAWKMQGTGNPHALAKITIGERVVDLGSGFGLDAVIASHAVGPRGHVVGVDLSDSEIMAAMRRISQRGLRNVDFRLGDIENLPLEDSSIDCALSNGGFCLVPDKRKAFREIYRVLRPGGRFSVSCTASRNPLDKSIKWPTCMLVFMPLWEAKEILTDAGFVDIEIIEEPEDIWSADSKKAVHGDQREPESQNTSGRVTVHRGDQAFSHLRSMNMNYLFPRINIFGQKRA